MTRKLEKSATTGVKHTIFRVRFTRREVVIPPNCPGCGADLTEPGALVEWNWNLCGVAGHLRRTQEGPAITGEGESKYTDTYVPDDVTCSTCELSVFAPRRITKGGTCHS